MVSRTRGGRISSKPLAKDGIGEDNSIDDSPLSDANVMLKKSGSQQGEETDDSLRGAQGQTIR